jgi:hypothetical protein
MYMNYVNITIGTGRDTGLHRNTRTLKKLHLPTAMALGDGDESAAPKAQQLREQHWYAVPYTYEQWNVFDPELKTLWTCTLSSLGRTGPLL